MSSPDKDFFGQLEEYLGRAAQRAARPRGPRLAGGVLVVGVVAVVAAIALAGGDDRERDLSAATPTATPSSDCGSVELLEVAPALDLPRSEAAPLGVGPRGARVGRDMARRVIREHGVSYWVAPRLRCDDGDLNADLACMVPILDEWNHDDEAPSVCGTPEEVRDGIWMSFPVDGDFALAGLAPPLTQTVAVRRDGELVTRLPVVEGAFGAIVERDQPGEVPGYDVDYEGVPRETRVIAVLDGGGDVERTVRTLHRRGFVAARAAGEAPKYPDPHVYFSGEAGAEIARGVEEALRLPQGAIPVPERIQALAPEALVYVVVGPS
jgi:hypothetical protein